MARSTSTSSWTPAAGGANFELSPTLKLLEPLREHLVVISNLKRAGGVAEMHAAAASGWLSGAVPKHTEGQDYRIGTTIDEDARNRMYGDAQRMLATDCVNVFLFMLPKITIANASLRGMWDNWPLPANPMAELRWA